jgi:hypothetical protein
LLLLRLLQGWLLHRHLSIVLSLVFSPNPLRSCSTVSNRCWLLLLRLLLLCWWLLGQRINRRLLCSWRAVNNSCLLLLLLLLQRGWLV